MVGLVLAVATQASASVEVYGRSGDVIRVDLKAGHGGQSFELPPVVRSGYRVLTSDELEGLPFSETGRFYVVPDVETAPRRSTDSVADRGFRGDLAIPVVIDGVAHDVSVTVRSGYTFDGALTVPGDGSVVSVAAAQQRLNYLGYQASNNSTLTVDGGLGSLTRSAVRLFQAVITPSGEINPGGFSGNLDANTVAWLNSHGAPEWVNLVDPDPPGVGGQRGGGSVPVYPSGVRGNFDIWTVTQERYGSSWSVETIHAASEALPGMHINTMSRRNGTDSICCHSTHQAGLDIDVDIPNSAKNFGNGVLSAGELEAVRIMRAFYENTPADARVWRIIFSNLDVRDEFNRQTGTNIAVGDSSGVHLSHLHIDLSRTRPGAGPGVSAADLNLDDSLDVEDVDLLMRQMGGDAFYYDLSGDGVVGAADLERLIEVELGTAFGDANLDGRVDLIDLSLLAGSFGDEGGWGAGDFNADGLVDLIDLSVLAGGFGFVAGVPEPVVLAALGLGVMMVRRGRG